MFFSSLKFRVINWAIDCVLLGIFIFHQDWYTLLLDYDFRVLNRSRRLNNFRQNRCNWPLFWLFYHLLLCLSDSSRIFLRLDNRCDHIHTLFHCNPPFFIEFRANILECLCRSQKFGLPFVLAQTFTNQALVDVDRALESLACISCMCLITI